MTKIQADRHVDLSAAARAAYLGLPPDMQDLPERVKALEARIEKLEQLIRGAVALRRLIKSVLRQREGEL